MSKFTLQIQIAIVDEDGENVDEDTVWAKDSTGQILHTADRGTIDPVFRTAVKLIKKIVGEEDE